jgi:D-arabinose 1-dehydrogenase-like Zn-dependent alcohol dehydrogenase
MTVKAYGARGIHDAQIDFAFCGVCHSDNATLA